MTTKNYEGLQGSASLKDSEGNPTTTTITAFWHNVDFDYKINEARVIILMKAWESKSEFKNGEADITNQFSDNTVVKYNVSDSVKVRKGKDVFDGDDSTTTFAFTKNKPSSKDYIYVEVDGVKKALGVDYTVSFDSGSSGTGSVTFTTAPATGSNNVKIYKQNRGWTDYFSKSKLSGDGQWPLKAVTDFLQDLDGDDETDPNGIDFKSLTRDSVE